MSKSTIFFQLCWEESSWVEPVLRPNKKISEFRVTGVKILGRVGTNIFFYHLFSGKKYKFMHFERHFAFQNS